MPLTEIDCNYMNLFGDIRSLLRDHSRPVAPELPKFEKEFADKKIELHHSYYFMWCQIITMDSVHLDRILDVVSYFVKSKNFKYDADSAPEELVFTLATSTYWLREAIFDANAYRYDINNPKIAKDYEKLNIAKYYDIGTTLINKGFDFKLSLDGMNGATISYASFYLKQCLKRNAYLTIKQK